MNPITAELVSRRDHLRHEIYTSVETFLSETGLRVTYVTVKWNTNNHPEVYVEVGL